MNHLPPPPALVVFVLVCCVAAFCLRLRPSVDESFTCSSHREILDGCHTQNSPLAAMTQCTTDKVRETGWAGVFPIWEGSEPGHQNSMMALVVLVVLVFAVVALVGEAFEVEVCVGCERIRPFKGFGTSLCWWANGVGQWTNETAFNEVMDLLFSDEKGLGLRTVRYNIGGGENPQYAHFLRPGAFVRGFQRPDRTFDWSADQSQRRVVKAALDGSVDIVQVRTAVSPNIPKHNQPTKQTTEHNEQRNKLHNKRITSKTHTQTKTANKEAANKETTNETQQTKHNKQTNCT